MFRAHISCGALTRISVLRSLAKADGQWTKCQQPSLEEPWTRDGFV